MRLELERLDVEHPVPAVDEPLGADVQIVDVVPELRPGQQQLVDPVDPGAVNQIMEYAPADQALKLRPCLVEGVNAVPVEIGLSRQQDDCLRALDVIRDAGVDDIERDAGLLADLVELQQPLRPGSFIPLRRGEVLRGALLLLHRKRDLRLMVGGCELHHPFVGWLVLHALVLVIQIQLAELVDPGQVKRIYVLPACRIRAVMAERQPVVVIDHQAAARGSCCISPPVLFCRRHVDVRDELLNCLRDRVRPAKCTDDAALCQRILDLFRLLAPLLGLPGAHRPFRPVFPVPVFAEDIIRIQEWRVVQLEHRLHVPAVARPVHQSVDLIGRIVKRLDPHRVRQLPGDGLILLRADLLRQRHDQPEPRLVRTVLVRRVEKCGEVRPVDHEILHAVPESAVRIVRVERHDLPAGDVGLEPAAVFEESAHKTADIFDLVLCVLCEAQELLMRLRRLAAVCQFRCQNGPPHGGVLPCGVIPVFSEADDQIPVMF